MAEFKRKARGLKAEIAGIVFFALSLLIGASLVFYHTGASHWVGIVGNNISAILFVILGQAAYVFPLLFLFLAYEFILRHGVNFRPSMAVSLFFFVISLAGLLSFRTPGDKAADWLAVGDGWFTGGIVGNVVNHYLKILLGPAGSVIVLGAVILISLRLGTGVSVIRFAEGFFAVAVFTARCVYRALSFLARVVKGKEEAVEKPASDDNEAVAEDIVKEEKPRPAPTIITHASQPVPMKHRRQRPLEPVQEKFGFLESAPGGGVAADGPFQLPPLSLLDPAPESKGSIDKETLLENSRILEKKLRDFGVEGSVVEVRPGPVVTTYEFEPAAGIKVGRITNLEDDLALAMKAVSIRILAPIPGKAVVGIEIPNQTREKILIGEILECPAFQKSASRLTLALGKDISGMPFVADLAKMPHLLVAGSTGAGKSVSVNAMILSILFKSTPEDVRFLMIDPKMLELSAYEGIPHLLTPVVTNPKRATVMLKGIVAEMEKRYRLMAEKGVKNIEGYNEVLSKKPGSEGGEHKKLPYILVVIDELADLMMASGKEVEESLVRLSQMARASGINLIVATQRPSVDVLTGLIKTNFPARISFQVPSRIDSRTILDAMGAEALLGEGDMLFLPPGSTRLKRVHGVYVSEPEIKRVTEFLKKQAVPSFEPEIIETRAAEKSGEEDELGSEFLQRYREAVRLAAAMEMISTSYIQRRFRIGYNTAARIIEKMEEEGIVGPAQGSRPREVLKRTVEE
ncbi:MAG: DNA translocase FtsK 4TM domain-containing protein [Deltaproteobacteria bacterium]|nr:DNA translocase FtsK 4TM domain-containing protein [Deltaproteobacteria bacterium]